MDLVHVEKSHDGKLRFPQQQQKEARDTKKSKKKSKKPNKAGHEGSNWPQNQVNNVNYESDGEGAPSVAAAGQGSSKNRDDKIKRKRDGKGHNMGGQDRKNSQNQKGHANTQGPQSTGFANR